MSVENLGERCFQQDVERIVAVGPAYVTIVLETIGTELDCLDEVRKLVREHAEIIPDPGRGPEPTHPEAA